MTPDNQNSKNYKSEMANSNKGIEMITENNVKQEFENLIKSKFGYNAKIQIGVDQTVSLIDRYPPNYVIRFGRDELEVRYSAYEQTDSECRYQKMVNKFRDYLNRIKPSNDDDRMKIVYVPKPAEKLKMTCICGKKATDTIQIRDTFIFPFCKNLDCEFLWNDAIYLLSGGSKNSDINGS